jgi:putative MATE family efflux protein
MSEPLSFWRDLVAVIRGARRDYTTLPIGRSILLLAIPMVLETSMQSIFTVCDAFFVAKLGSAAIASIGLTEAILAVIFSIGLGLSMGTAAMVARRIGEQDDEGAAVATVQALVLACLVAGALGLIGAAWASELFTFMGADDAVLEIGLGYGQWMLGGSVTILLLFLLNAAFRGAGDPMLALKALTLANGLNLILDPILIFGLGPIPAMGVTGAAVATTLGRTVGISYQLWVLFRGNSRLHLERRHLKIVTAVMQRLLRLSGFAVFQFFVATTSYSAMVRILAPYSSEALAGFTIAIRVIVFVLLPAWGLANASATLVGQNLGAKKPERATRAVWVTGSLNMAFLSTVAIFFFVFSRQLVEIFTTEVMVVEIGAECLRLISFGYPFMAWGFIFSASFNGAGDTATPTWINLACHWGLKLPLAYVLAGPLGWGLTGIFASIPVAESAVAIVAVILFLRGGWKHRNF